MPHEDPSTDDPTPGNDTVTSPLGHCENCGEALAWVPCTNCKHPNGSAEVADE